MQHVASLMMVGTFLSWYLFMLFHEALVLGWSFKQEVCHVWIGEMVQCDVFPHSNMKTPNKKYSSPRFNLSAPSMFVLALYQLLLYTLTPHKLAVSYYTWSPSMLATQHAVPREEGSNPSLITARRATCCTPA
jgi:hypothetical protein